MNPPRVFQESGGKRRDAVWWLFMETCGSLCRMDKREHGQKLKAAMASRGLSRQEVADAVGVRPRTITNWTSGSTMPEPAERELLRRLFGGYDHDGDPVERAVRGSELTEWRQDAVLSFYKRNLHEQRAEAAM